MDMIYGISICTEYNLSKKRISNQIIELQNYFSFYYF